MIIFEVLKIIGYILLVLLGLLLFVLLSLLFVPVFYKFNFNSENEFSIKGKVKLLFGILIADIVSDKDEKLQIKFLGHPLKNINLQTQDYPDEKSDKLKEEEAIFNMSVMLENEDRHETEDNDSSSLKIKLINLLKRIKDFFIRLINVINNLKNNVVNICDFISDENVITAFTEHKGRILKILTHLGPKKSNLVLDFGFEDPAATGYILAMISPFFPVYNKWISINPNFEKKLFKLNGDIKGRVYLYYLLWHFVRVYFNKNVKNIRNKFKKPAKGEC